VLVVCARPLSTTKGPERACVHMEIEPAAGSMTPNGADGAAPFVAEEQPEEEEEGVVRKEGGLAAVVGGLERYDEARNRLAGQLWEVEATLVDRLHRLHDPHNVLPPHSSLLTFCADAPPPAPWAAERGRNQWRRKRRRRRKRNQWRRRCGWEGGRGKGGREENGDG